MHLVCEFHANFSSTNIHAPNLTYWLKDALLVDILSSRLDNYSSGYNHFLAHQLQLPLPLPTTALQRHWAGKRTAQQAWGTLQLINLQAGRDEVGLQLQQDLHITTAEHEAITRSIEPLLQEDGFALETQSPGLWHISGNGLAPLQCADLARLAGHELRSFMPQSDEPRIARQWWRLSNELQMLLYNHEVNDARASSVAGKQPALSALWLSGCGALPAPAPAAPVYTYALVDDAAYIGTQLDALLQRHQPRKLTLCSTERYLTLEKAPFMQRLFKPGLTLESLLSQL